jgi:PAS domain S-box-containing protein
MTSLVLRYGIAVVSVSIALGLGLFFQRFTARDVEFAFCLFAVAITVWYAGTWAGVLAVVLSGLGVDYFFTEPRYSLTIALTDIPYFIIYTASALLVAGFSSTRRRIEQELSEARDKLVIEVAERTQQASLLNLTHDTIFVRDMNDVITYWNRGAQEFYGWTAEEAIGKRAHQLLQTVSPVPIDEIHAELLRADRWEGELEKMKADGTRVVVSSRWALVRDEQQRPVSVLATNNDITARKRAEEHIRELNEVLAKRTIELEASNRDLEAFAYSVSHDLRAPLRHIVGYTELLQKNANPILDAKSRRHMMMILESAKQMGSLIDDLLAFSKMGRAEMQKTIISLDQLVKEALRELRQETNGRNIVWRFGTLPNLYGDRSMLKLALVNLISNSVKFTRTRPKPEIEIGCTDGGKDEIIVIIRDNGVGFDMKYVNKLFGVFQRLHRAEEFEGTGIGLANVQRIIHRHGGRVWAEGLVERGATFYFSFPKSQEAVNYE